jgi:glycosyltransferase
LQDNILKVSVITATFNSARTIECSLNSLLSQSYGNIEHIVVDGASSDDTLQIIEKIIVKSSINHKITSKKDSGLYDALNKGISYATGDIIAFLHSDDAYAYSDAIKDIVGLFKKNNIDGAYADLHYVKDGKLHRNWVCGEFCEKKVKKGWMPAHPTFFLKKSVYEKYGCFNLNYKISADYDFILRTMTDGIRVGYLPKVIYKMSNGGTSNRSIGNRIIAIKESYIALRSNKVCGVFKCFFVTIRKSFSKINQFFK